MPLRKMMLERSVRTGTNISALAPAGGEDLERVCGVRRGSGAYVTGAVMFERLIAANYYVLHRAEC